MKMFKFLIFVLISTVIFAVSITAQTEEKLDITSSKIALVNPKAFEDEKTGIKDLAIAYKQLEIEVEPQMNELKVEAAKLQDLVKHLEYPDEPVKDPKILKQEIEAKFEEYQKLFSEFKIKEKSYKLLVDNRYSETITPIKNKIGDALKQFAKEKSYVMVLDNSQNNSSAIIEGDIIDITNEFIKSYNDLSEKAKAQ